jgi:hypothetical protein
MHQVRVRQKLASLVFAPKVAAALAFATAMGAAPAFAHHSGAMFDNTKTVTLTGAVKEFKWINPHASIELVTVDAKGQQMLWSIECSTPNILVRHGWSVHSLKPGDMVSLTAHPMRDGGQGAFVLAVTTSTGSVLKDHDY